MVEKADIEKALREVNYPGFSRDVVSFGLVRSVEVAGGKVGVRLTVTTADPSVPERLKNAVGERLVQVPGVEEVDVHVAVGKPQGVAPGATGGGQGSGGQPVLPQVRFKVAIASGKGGVGKSTFAVNLACALEQSLAKEGIAAGARVGLMDCDIYGPSVPLMMGIQDQPRIRDNAIEPLENFGVRVMSMGLLIDETTPVVWRGPMVMKTIQQFAQNVEWGQLEVLLIDLPPGTGDAQLSLAQTIPLDGAIIVTTPQTAAVNVASRGARMFEKVNVPLLGVAENMSFLEDPATGQRQYLFGQGGGQRSADALGTALLGQIPLDPEIREGCDHGVPIVHGSPDSGAAQAFAGIASRILVELRSSTRQ